MNTAGSTTLSLVDRSQVIGFALCLKASNLNSAHILSSYLSWCSVPLYAKSVTMMTDENNLHDGDVKDTDGFPAGSKDSEETTPSSASAIGDRSRSILNRQDDPFAPREGKTLVWTGVSMTLVCSRVCFFNAPLASIPHNPSYSSIDTRYDRHRKAKGLSANC
jgi:hypothetical protein